jgi:hypothetical protein
MVDSEFIADDDKEYVFRFKLNVGEAQKADRDPLTEMVRSFIADFLNIGYFTYKGNRVQVDGFTFALNPEKHYAVFNEGLSKREKPETPFNK